MMKLCTNKIRRIDAFKRRHQHHHFGWRVSAWLNISFRHICFDLWVGIFYINQCSNTMWVLDVRDILWTALCAWNPSNTSEPNGRDVRMRCVLSETKKREETKSWQVKWEKRIVSFNGLCIYTYLLLLVLLLFDVGKRATFSTF